MITGNDKLSNDRFLLLIIQLVLVVILFYTYFPLNGAIKEMHNNGQGIGGGWWFIIIGWVLFIEPLILIVYSKKPKSRYAFVNNVLLNLPIIKDNRSLRAVRSFVKTYSNSLSLFDFK